MNIACIINLKCSFKRLSKNVNTRMLPTGHMPKLNAHINTDLFSRKHHIRFNKRHVRARRASERTFAGGAQLERSPRDHHAVVAAQARRRRHQPEAVVRTHAAQAGHDELVRRHAAAHDEYSLLLRGLLLLRLGGCSCGRRISSSVVRVVVAQAPAALEECDRALQSARQILSHRVLQRGAQVRRRRQHVGAAECDGALLASRDLVDLSDERAEAHVHAVQRRQVSQ